MVRVGARYGVSSSFLARVCSALNVPRPPRGYWARIEFGKTAGKPPPLPMARPEDRLVWNRTNDADVVRRPLPMALATPRQPRRPPSPALPKVHPLVDGTRGLFTKGRKTETGLLKPSKKLLVDLVVTEALLDEMLAVANDLFQALERAGHRVLIAPEDLKCRRWPVDEREAPKEVYRHNGPSSPQRPTIVLIGTVAIGLTIFEMTQELECQYLGDSRYVPLAQLSPEERRLALRRNYWTAKKDFATGRMCLQAYSTYRVADWVSHWRESGPQELQGKVGAIVKALERSAGELASLVKEGERQAEIERTKREEEWRRYKAEEELRRKTRARADARTDLLQAIASWSEVKRIQKFFNEAEADAQKLDATAGAALFDRIRQARDLIGSVDALDALREWKTPNER